MTVYSSTAWPEGAWEVPLHLIRPNFTLTNDRKEFDPDELADLAASIEQHGLLQKPTVRPLPKWFEGKCVFCECEEHAGCSCPVEVLELVAGDRRTKAVEMLGRETIAVEIRHLSDEAVADAMLLENVQRADLNAIEEARAYELRMKRFGYSEWTVAEKANVPRMRVRARLALLLLPEHVQALIASGQMPVGAAEVIADAGEVMPEVLSVWMKRKNMNVGEVKELVRRLRNADAQGALFETALWAEDAATAKVPIIGPKVEIVVPVDERLPDVGMIVETDNVGVVLRRWIDKLESYGMTPEAAAVGKVYVALVHARLCYRGEDMWTRVENQKGQKGR